jgi:predicted nucleic acid-binding protein
MRQRQAVFVDTGAWIALALSRDPLHGRAREIWEMLLANGARLFTSIPVVLETLTFAFDHHFAAVGFRIAG